MPLQWRHNERDGVSNHQPHDCLLKRFFRRRSKKTSKLRVTGLCEGNSPVTGKFPAQRASTVENVSIWWRHHGNSIPSIFDFKMRRYQWNRHEWTLREFPWRLFYVIVLLIKRHWCPLKDTPLSKPVMTHFDDENIRVRFIEPGCVNWHTYC